MHASTSVNQKYSCVTYDDVVHAETIFGPDLGSLKGKSVRSTPAPIILSTPVSVPAPIFQHHKHVCISADIFYIDGAMFFMTISCHLQFKTVNSIDSKKHDVIFKCFSQVIHLYKKRGFIVSTVISDHEFQPLSRRLLEVGATLNASTADEHAPEIERAIRVIKKRAQAHLVMIPFSHYPRLLKRHLIHHLITLVNLTVHPNSVSPYFSPATIVTGLTFDAQLYCSVKFGSYCQALDEPTPLNSTVKRRTLDTLALRPTGNRQGGHYFLHITSWSLIERRKWTIVPMPEHVISLVNQRAIKESQHDSDSSLQFKRRNKTLITSLAIDDSYLLTPSNTTQGARDAPTVSTESNIDPTESDADVVDSSDNNTEDNSSTSSNNSIHSSDTPNDNDEDADSHTPHDSINDDDADVVYDYDPTQTHTDDADIDNNTVSSSTSDASLPHDDTIDNIPPPTLPIPPNEPVDNL